MDQEDILNFFYYHWQQELEYWIWKVFFFFLFNKDQKKDYYLITKNLVFKREIKPHRISSVGAFAFEGWLRMATETNEIKKKKNVNICWFIQ